MPRREAFSSGGDSAPVLSPTAKSGSDLHCNAGIVLGERQVRGDTSTAGRFCHASKNEWCECSTNDSFSLGVGECALDDLSKVVGRNLVV